MTEDFNPDEIPTGDRPAAAGSALTSLRDRRKKQVETLYTDLAVPRYEPPIYVRFNPVDQARVDAIFKRADKSKDPAKVVKANAALLADACVGVFEIDADGEEVSVNPDGDEWPKFDQELWDLIRDDDDRRDITNASDVVRKLYFTDGDLIATARALAEWSGFTADDLEREGN